MGDPWEGNSRRRRLRRESRTRSGRGTLVEEDRSADPSAAENRTGADEESQCVRGKNERPTAAAGVKPRKTKIRTAAARKWERKPEEKSSLPLWRRRDSGETRTQEKPRERTLALEGKGTAAAHVRQLVTQQGVKRAGPQSTQAEPKSNEVPPRTRIRPEIKTLNTQRKIPDLEPTQSRCKLQVFQRGLNNVYIQTAEVSALPPSFRLKLNWHTPKLRTTKMKIWEVANCLHPQGSLL
jgi:hypothetical protein